MSCCQFSSRCLTDIVRICDANKLFAEQILLQTCKQVVSRMDAAQHFFALVISSAVRCPVRDASGLHVNKFSFFGFILVALSMGVLLGVMGNIVGDLFLFCSREISNARLFGATTHFGRQMARNMSKSSNLLPGPADSYISQVSKAPGWIPCVGVRDPFS